MAEYLPYLIGAGLLILANRFGITLPFQVPPLPSPAPTPTPAPVITPPVILSQPGADRELTTALVWCQAATNGVVRIDPEDRIALSALAKQIAILNPEAK